MNKNSALIISLATLMTAAVACDQDSNIGSSLVQDELTVYVDSNFTVTGHSVKIDSVQSRTTTQMLGRINAKGFGYLQSNIVTQFMPSTAIDTTNFTALDSLVLYMYVLDGGYVGDSIAPMGMNIYRLNKNLPTPIYSNFDPSGYYDKKDLLASTVYNVTRHSSDTIISGAVEISVKMPKTLAQELYDSFKANPANFSSPTAFSNNVFKGIYIENSFGSGRIINSTTTAMTLFYHHTYQISDSTTRDTTVYRQGNYFAVSPEIITNNDLKFDISPSVLEKIETGKQQIMMAPLGYGVEIKFPAPDIINALKSKADELTLLNTVSFAVPSEGVDNEYGFDQPPYLLMVRTKDIAEFFRTNSLPDNITSFYAAYDATIGGYDFGEMRAFIAGLWLQDTYDESDYTFTILPVTATFETSSSYYQQTSTLSLITPYIATPVMGRLLLDQAKIKLTYTTDKSKD